MRASSHRSQSFEERLLHQLLGVVTVPGHEVESLEEAYVLLLEERVEAGPCLDAFRREPHHLTLCSHEPWTREGHVPLMCDAREIGRAGALRAPALQTLGSRASGVRDVACDVQEQRMVAYPLWCVPERRHPEATDVRHLPGRDIEHADPLDRPAAAELRTQLKRGRQASE